MPNTITKQLNNLYIVYITFTFNMATEKQKKKYRDDKARRRAQNIANKTYYCEKCDKSYDGNTYFNQHLTSTKHIDGYVSYKCDLIIDGKECNFNTTDKSKYNMHLKTKKHNYGVDK